MPSTFSLSDIRFLLSRVNGTWLPEELNGAAPLGPTGIRNVQGLGNNTGDINKPGFWFGAADTLFPRLTFNRLTDPLKKNDLISSPFANTPRGTDANGNPYKVVIGNTTTVNGQTVDALNPRNISNLIADSSNSIGFSKQNAEFKLLDDPTGRISPTSGNINPLVYSNWMSQFGQFFDHGLDFVAKGVDGKFSATLMPGDSIYNQAMGATSITSSRNNTVNVTIGDGSSDDLLQKLGILAANTPQSGDIVSWKVTSTLTKPSVSNGAFTFEGTLILNNTLIKIQAMDEQDLAAQINLWTATTGVTATLTPFPSVPGVSEAGAYNLTLTPARAESFNQTSPFVDLSQNYGSDTSRTVFLREYITATPGVTKSVTDVTTGRLLNAGATTGDLVGNSGMADWTQVKANAAKIGIILHDADISAIPQIAIDNYGHMILDANGMPQLVAIHKVTGDIVYIKDTTLANNANIAGDAANYVLLTTKHAFLNDMGISLPGLDDPGAWNGRDLKTAYTGSSPYIPPNFNLAAALGEHLVSGDGRLNENIGLTAVHEVFLNEHNRVLDLLKAQYGIGQPGGLPADQPPGGWTWTDPLTGQVSTITGESLFQQAKLVVEMEYQHMVFAEFARKLSPNIPAFAAVNPAINADIPAEFAHAVYRLGHSMLPDQIGMRQYTDASNLKTAVGSGVITVTMANHGLTTGTSITLSQIDANIGGIDKALLNGTFTVTKVDANTFTFTVQGASATSTNTVTTPDNVQIDVNKGLFDAFLSPGFYDPGATAKWLGSGSSAQVGMAIDEKVGDALRDNLLRQPLDLATLNLMRGRDAGMPTLNEMRAALQPLAPVLLQPTLNPYTSWLNFRDNLKGTVDDQNVTVKNFMMAYAADAILTKWGQQGATAAGITQPADLAAWYALRESTNATDRDAYMTALKTATELAFADATFMNAGPSGNKDFNRIDAWIGGLAEKVVIGGMLGSTFDTVFSMTMLNLQNGDQFYYLGRVPATEFFNENIDGSLLSDLVSRSTGTKYLYGDIFSVADKTVMMNDVAVSASANRFTTLANLQAAQTLVDGFDAQGNPIKVSIGRAGYVDPTPNNTANGDAIFYGNSGDYLDARGVKSPNGIGNASETIVGTAGADNIQSLGGNDTVWGEGGNDNIQGGAGVDFLHGGDGNDILNGGADNDFMYGEAGNDTMRGDIGIDTMFGGDGNDTMFGGAEGDLMVAGTGNDVMYGGDGVVTGGVTGQVLIGGVLTNIFIRGLIDPEVIASVALIDDVMHGGQNDDVLYGGGGWDNLIGESGHDVLVPGTGGAAQGGREVMDGGEGDDIYIVESDIDFAFMDINDTGLTQAQRGTNIDTYRQGRGIGVDEVRFTQNVAGSIIIGQTNNLGVAAIFSGIERVVLNDGTAGGGTAAIDIDALLAVPGINVGLEIIGNAGVNNIIGTTFDDTINGGGGADNMDGGNGNDTYIVDNANDLITELAGGGTDTVIVTSNANYTLATDLENLTLQGTNNGQSGTGNNLANIIIGSTANNTLSGNAGDDQIYGGNGNDTISGGDGLDKLFGEAGNDTINGNAGNDSIDGGAGNDTINGGAGIDTLTGGANADRFVFSSVADIGTNANIALLETITDFQSGTDRIDLTAIDANTITNGNQTFNYIGGNAFSGTGAPNAANAGQLRYDTTNGVLEGDTNGDGTADFRMRVLPPGSFTPNALPLLQSTDFILPIAVSVSGGGNVNEGNTGQTSTHTFTVTLDTAVTVDTTITWTVTGTGGNAANAADFGGTLPSGTVVVLANNNSATFNVVVSGDLTVEQSETFQVTVSNPTQATQTTDTFIIGTGTATSTIVNDDVFNVINGNNNNNTLNGTANADQINGNGGNDTLNGNAGDDALNGGLGNDILNGGDGNDTLDGGTGTDVLNGGNGNDFMIGSAGRDTFNGGAGVDTFKFNAAISEIGTLTAGASVTNDVIQAFVSGSGDVIDLSLIDANTVLANDQAFTFIGNANFTGAGQLRYANGQLQGNVDANNTADFTITFTNGVPGTLQAADFIL